MASTELSLDGRTLITDGVLAAAFALATCIPLVAVRSSGFFWAALGWSLLMCAAIAIRRVVPMLALVVVTGAGIGMIATLDVPLPSLLAIPVVIYSVGRYQRLYAGFFVLLFAIAGSIAGPMSWLHALPEQYQFLGISLLVMLCFAVVCLAYLLGRLQRERRMAAALDREVVTERFVAAQRHSEQETALAERSARIEVAQELHDVLAHSLSVIVVQAEGAKALTTKRPEAAVEALTVIAETGRNSITEVRRIVSVMRGDEQQTPSFGPAPALSQIPALVERAGDRVALEVHGEPPLVPELLGLTAFRVVQEAVTNFLKHAGPTATAQVRVSYGTEGIDIRVRDDGIGALAASDEQGSGLVGMRERVSAMGGELKAAPRPGGGYEVNARLPLPSRLGTSWLREA